MIQVTGHWLSGGGGGGGGGVSNPTPASLENFIFCWLLLGPFPDLLQCCSRGSPRFSSIQRERFCCGVGDPDFDVHGQVR